MFCCGRRETVVHFLYAIRSIINYFLFLVLFCTTFTGFFIFLTVPTSVQCSHSSLYCAVFQLKIVSICVAIMKKYLCYHECPTSASFIESRKKNRTKTRKQFRWTADKKKWFWHTIGTLCWHTKQTKKKAKKQQGLVIDFFLSFSLIFWKVIKSFI